MLKNKINKILAVSLLGVIGLTSCSSNDIQAKPADYDEKIINVEGYDEEIYNNILSVVYDSIRDGNLSKDVLDEVLYQFSISVFGKYNNVIADSSNSTSLKAAVKDIKANTNADGKVSGANLANAFIKAHKAYWSYNADGKRINDDETTVTVVNDDADSCQSEYARVVAKWETIENRIAENMYAAISGGSYSDRNIFSEKNYLMSLRSSLAKVSNPMVTAEISHGLYKGLLYPDIEENQVFDAVDVDSKIVTVLHRDYYQSNYKLDETETKSNANTYVEDNIIPTIYRSLLVEQYLLDETYNTLGRSYARKVNIISIKSNSNYLDAAGSLMNTFVSNYINAKPNANSVEESTNKITLSSFNMLSNAYRGIDLNDDEKALLNASNIKSSSYNGVTYYKGTQYGDLVEKEQKINDDLLLNDSSIESEFTGSGAYPISVGKEILTNNIRLENYTTNGWFVKNGGLSDLPSSIRDRLFSIGVANGVKEDSSSAEAKAQDRWQYVNNNWEYNKENDGNNSYVCKVNGKYYLKLSTTEQTESNNDMLFYDRSSSTYYIVQIEEAVSSSKLSKTSENRYAVLRSSGDMQTIVNEVAKIIAQGESYSSLSTKYWLEKINFKIHDTVVYDYFKSNYPELFED